MKSEKKINERNHENCAPKLFFLNNFIIRPTENW